ncbi:MAG: DUF362 domain-containing protein [Candidatus Freyarchaeota archaeon]
MVSIVKTDGNVEDAVRRAVELAGGIKLNGETVLLKPNLCAAKPSGSGIVTSTEVVSAMVKLVKDLGGEVLVGDLPIAGWDPEETYRVTGMREAVEAAGGTFVDFSKDEAVTIQIPSAKKLKKVKVVKTALTVDAIISLPVLKAHFFTGLTLSIKNLKGLTWQDQRTKIHVLGLHEPVVDLLSAFRQKLIFSLVDGTVGCEAIKPSGPLYGPTEGKPVRLNLIVAGADPVAVDSVTARIAGLDPHSMKILKIASERGLGEIEDIEIRGEDVKPFKLKRRFMDKILQALNVLWTSRTVNPIVHPLAKKIYGPQIESLRAVEKELEKVEPSRIIVDREKCNLCGVCVKACKIGNIAVKGDNLLIGDNCLGCLICVESCPESALSIKVGG